MEQSNPTTPAASSAHRWWKRVLGKPAGELALDFALFVLGVIVLYVIDLTVLQRGAPIAFQYMIDLVIYLNHHAVAAVQTLY
jgi:hypothetical protein